jgi:hypothetical protein
LGKFIFKIVSSILLIGAIIYWAIGIIKQKIRFQNNQIRLTFAMQRTLKIQQDLNDQLKIAKDFVENYPQSCAKIAPSIYEQNRSLLKKLIKANKNIK